MSYERESRQPNGRPHHKLESESGRARAVRPSRAPCATKDTELDKLVTRLGDSGSSTSSGLKLVGTIARRRAAVVRALRASALPRQPGYIGKGPRESENRGGRQCVTAAQEHRW